MDDLTYLASHRSAITTLFTLVLFCALAIKTWPAIKYPYKLNRQARISTYWLVLIYFVFAMNDGDWFHLHNLFQDFDFRLKDISEVSSQSAGLEAAYLYIAKLVGFEYLLFRLVVWGGTALFSFYLCKRLSLNKSLYIFFFVIIALDIFSFQRGALAMSLSFLGFSYIVKPIDKSRILSFCIGMALIAFSTLFHKSAFILIPVYLFSFLQYKKKTVVLFVLIMPIVIYVLNTYLAGFLLNLNTDSDVINVNVMQSYLERDNRQMGIGSILRNIMLPLMFISLFVYMFKQVVIKKTLLPNYIVRYYNCAFIIIVFSFLLLVVGATGAVINVSILYLRFLYFSVLPLTIVICYIYNLKPIRKIPFFIILCIVCSLYKIILNLLGTIFLDNGGS